MSVWDPLVELQFKRDYAVEGTQAAGTEWIPEGISLPPKEVREIIRLELIPAVDATTGLIRKIRYITLLRNGGEFLPININHLMAPLDGHLNAAIAVDFGLPYLWRPITGRLPLPAEGTCPKYGPGDILGIKVIADEDITEDYMVILRFARVRTEAKLRKILGPAAIPISFKLDEDVYTKPAIAPTLDNFTKLPGGGDQAVPKIFPWFVWATNKQATTANTWYEFTYPKFVTYPWQVLFWNLVNKEAAYLVKALSVWPHDNSKAARLYVEGRITNPEYVTRPLPEKNWFMPPMYRDTAVNADLKRAGPRALPLPYIFHGVKGGIQIIHNGTSIPADGIMVAVWGTKFELK